MSFSLARRAPASSNLSRTLPSSQRFPLLVQNEEKLERRDALLLITRCLEQVVGNPRGPAHRCRLARDGPA
jgi:hypothetical protein